MNLDDMIAAERSAPAEATKAQAAQVWQSIEHSFVAVAATAGPPAAAAKASTLGKLGLGKLSAAVSTTTGKVLLATAVLTGGAAGVSHLDSAARDTPKRELSSSRPEEPRVVVPRPVQPNSDTPPTALLVEDAPEQPLMQPPLESQPAAPAEPKKLASSPSQPHLRAARVRPAAKPATSVQSELALIRRTQSAVRSGSYDRALSLARQHAMAYPDGGFVEDREALRALALCESDNPKGPGAASKFRKRWPKSMHRRRVEAACE